MNDRFPAKRWIPVALAALLTPLGLVMLMMGAAMLSGGMMNARGEAVTAGGWPCLLVGGPLACSGVLAWYQALALRTPPIRLCPQGVAVTVAGATSLDGLPPIPGLGLLFGLVRGVWGVATGQGFRSQTYVAAWESVADARVRGIPGSRVLTIDADFTPADGRATYYRSISFPQHLFHNSLENIAYTVMSTADEPALRRGLPPLDATRSQDREEADEISIPDPAATLQILADRIKRSR